jgi:hypothetical protein
MTKTHTKNGAFRVLLAGGESRDLVCGVSLLPVHPFRLARDAAQPARRTVWHNTATATCSHRNAVVFTPTCYGQTQGRRNRNRSNCWWWLYSGRMSTARRWALTLLYYCTTLAAALVVKDLGTLWCVRVCLRACRLAPTVKTATSHLPVSTNSLDFRLRDCVIA